ncbi:hypothetical protein BDM02DRAFT_872738 [Thelephora ganbajun]|uniref:Uncharacterized protein n=1 Tax=Thelephora ganbajun TaxID=370292 RepID=A0ACB6Z4T9_THEGA|nr:hypothetical protein BDM02DRAFT_872738 [Thelephora ganbajun]
MCRYIEEVNALGEREQQVYGVLTDYDLSSWTKDLKTDYTRTSQQRTGTPPYMAQELLKGTSTTHLYRHDVESLFYIMLLTCGRHTFGHAKEGAGKETTRQMVMREGGLPYEDWFKASSYTVLGSIKGTFFADIQDIDVSPSFKDFRGWLLKLRNAFSRGFTAKQHHAQAQCFLLEEDQTETLEGTSTPATFDEETLGGYVNYSTVVEPTRSLAGELKGLVIRYDHLNTPTPSLSTLSGTTRTDA